MGLLRVGHDWESNTPTHYWWSIKVRFEGNGRCFFLKDTIQIILGPSWAIESLVEWYMYCNVISYIISHMNTMENIVLGRYYYQNFRRHVITSQCALSSSIMKMWFWNAQPWKIDTLINSFDHVIKFLLVTWKIILISFLKEKCSISLFPHSFLLFERQT